MTECCEICKFHDRHKCRRYPPKIFTENYKDSYGETVTSFRAMYPEVNVVDWCGEFIEKPPEDLI